MEAETTMDLAVIDTLKFADHLKTAGFSPRQAEGLARALGDELGERMVVKRDLDDAVQAMNRNLNEAVQAINSTIGTLNAKFESRFEAMDQRFEAMDQRFEAMDQRFVAMDQKFVAWTRNSSPSSRPLNPGSTPSTPSWNRSTGNPRPDSTFCSGPWPWVSP